MNVFLRSFLTLAAVCATSAAASAQHDYFRAFQKEVGRMVIPGSGTDPLFVLLAMEPNFDPVAGCSLDGAEAVAAAPASWDLLRHGSMALDFQRVGGMQVLDDDEILISGSKTTSQSPYAQVGRIYHVRVVADGVHDVSYTVLQQVSLTGIDPWRIAWNKNSRELHVLDYQRRRMVHALWDHAANAPLPTSFTDVADPSGELAEVLDPIAYTYVAMPGIGSEIEDYPETTFVLGNAATRQAVEIDYGGSGHSFTRFTVDVPNLDVAELVGDRTVFGPNLPILTQIVNGTVPVATLELRDALTAKVIESVDVVPGSIAAFTAHTKDFLDDPGRVYLVRDPNGEVGGFLFRSQLRYGDPQSQPSFSISRGMMPAYGAAPDYPFGVGVDYRHDGSIAVVGANLHVGFRTETVGGYTDPVSFQGSTAILTPAFTVPFQFDPTVQGATIGHEIPLLDQDVGKVVLFQYEFGWVDDQGSVQTVRSDVFGTRVVKETWVDPSVVLWD